MAQKIILEPITVTNWQSFSIQQLFNPTKFVKDGKTGPVIQSALNPKGIFESHQ